MACSEIIEHIFKKRAWTFREVNGDLFTAPKEYSLAHCVGADLSMGAGIAIRFRNSFGRIVQLRAQEPKVGGLAVLTDGKRFVYYLVTKRFSNQKPKYADLLRSLLALRKHMKANGVKRLAIPRIGCGLDRLEWTQVYDLLYRVFNADNVEILLYEYKSK